MRAVLLLLMIIGVAYAAAPVKIVLVGDSTINPEGGWGPGFRASFDDSIEVVNLAANGRSSKSFRDEGRWKKALEAKPDYVIMAFGHNDVPGKGPERETDPMTTYHDNMARFIDEARAIGAKPILATSIVRRSFGADGKWKPDSLAPYVEATRALAAEKSVPLLEMYGLTRAQAEALGNAGCEAQVGAVDKDGKPDHTHLGPKGQASIGAMAAKEFTRVLPEFEKHRHEMVAWKAAMHQSAGWYGSAEAARIAKNVIAYQHGNGGWTKNVDMALPNVGDTAKEGTTIDNGATHTQLRYLAKVYEATKRAEYLAAINNGVDYLLAAQYSNGGWPQFYPLRHGYWDHITYNDDAMIGVMELLRDISKLVPEKSAKIQGALGKGLEVILKTQIREGGKLTAWCAQHDEVTLAPAMARKYEHPSISGSESVGVVEYLMSIARPSPEVIAAIHGAVNWFKANRIPGIRIERVNGDKVVVQDAEAPPQWARFYELGTDKPIFSGRDSVVKYSIAEIEAERRNGYNWYSDRPAKLLTAEYPAWVQRNGLGK